MLKNLLLITIFHCALILNAQNNKPNIIFIEVDDLPAHYTTMLGAEHAKTPTIDKLTEEGVFFKNAVCQGTMCGPSRNSLITGVYPHNLGFYQNGPFEGLAPNVWTLPAALQRAGYYTAHIGKSHIHPSKVGLTGTKQAISKKGHENLGFNYVWNSMGRAVVGSKEPKLGIDSYVDFLIEEGYYEHMKAERKKISTLPEDIYLDGLFTKLSEQFIEERKDEPYFLWLNYSIPHGPYDVAQKYHEGITPEMMPQINNVNDKGENIPALLRPHIISDQNKILKEQLGNFANINFLDYQVSRIVKAVEKTGLKENTIIVFFSDHGILVGDHGLHHKGTLYNEVINPALIVYDPRAKKNGRTIVRPVELQDLLKTTMDWAGASQTDKNTPFGESLIPLIENKKGYNRSFAVAESPGYYAMVTNEFKYIAPFDFQKDGYEVLFDLKNDPNETFNIASQSPDKIEEFRILANEWLAQTGAPKIQKEKPKKKKK